MILLCGADTPIHTVITTVTKKLSLDANDVRIAAGISCALYALSINIKQPHVREFLQTVSIAVPFCAALCCEKILTTLNKIPLIKESIKMCEFCSYLPGLDFFFQCTNKKCRSICSHCKLRRSYQMVPLFAGIAAISSHTNAYYHYHYDPLKKEFVNLIKVQDTCSICLEEYTNQRLPIQLHQDKTSQIKHYICTQCYQDTYATHREPNHKMVTRQIDDYEFLDYELDTTPCSHCHAKCPLCKQKLDPKSLLEERLEYAQRYQKKATSK